MAKRITGSTPKLDGYRMPAEFEPQAGVWMLWPERNDNWRDGAKPAQKAFLDVATAILQFEPVTVCVSPAQYQNARERLPRAVRVVEMASNDAWIRDCGPTFLVNDRGGLRAGDLQLVKERRLGRVGFQYRQSQFQRGSLDRAGRELAAAAGRRVGAGDDADHIKTWIGGKGLERGHRYIGGAGEHEFEHGPP